MTRVVRLRSRERWEILCRDRKSWLAGLYQPEFSSRREVDRLERHDVPELFIHLRGRVNLLLKSGRGPVRVRLLKPGEALWVPAGEWHNGFRERGGAALVIERPGGKTEFRPLAGGAFK